LASIIKIIVGSVATLTLLLRKSTRFHDKKNTRFTKKHKLTKTNVNTVKMARKCVAMPTRDIITHVDQRQTKPVI